MKPPAFDVSVPASLSNLGPGYDVLGLAVSLANDFHFVLRPSGVFEDEQGRIEAADHLALHTAVLAGEAFGSPVPGLSVSQTERVPRSRGLGSSSTARVAGLCAWRFYSGVELPTDEALAFLAEQEGHPDNVLPAMLGGLTLALDAETGLRHLRLDPPALRVALCIPDREVQTSEARAILPETVPRSDAIFNLSRMGWLMAGLVGGNADAIAEGLHDRIHQPYRAPLIGPVGDAFAGASASGAAGAFISGSGSTLAAFVLDDAVDAQQVAEAMAAPFRRDGTSARALVLHPVATGAWAF